MTSLKNIAAVLTLVAVLSISTLPAAASKSVDKTPVGLAASSAVDPPTTDPPITDPVDQLDDEELVKV